MTFLTSISHVLEPGTGRDRNLLGMSAFLLEQGISDSNIRLFIELCAVILWLFTEGFCITKLSSDKIH